MITVSGYVLAGGKSCRMGTDKASLTLGSKTFVERAADALSAIAEKVTIVGNSAGKVASVETIKDRPVGTDQNGAMVGLYTALAHCETEWAAVLACDLPFVEGELFCELLTLINGNTDAVLPEQPDGRLQPLCGLYRPRTCLPHIESILAGDDWRLSNLTARLNVRTMSFPAIPNWSINVNTPEDLQIANGLIDG